MMRTRCGGVRRAARSGGRGRRGMEVVTAVLWMVVLVVVILVMLAIFFAIRNAFFHDPEDTMCASQILAHSTLAGLTNNEVASEINCPTVQRTADAANSDAVNRIIADEMVGCWKRWGEGDISLFGRNEGVYCHVCSVIDVTAERINNLPGYLEATPVENRQTYAQFLAGDEDGTVFDSTRFPEYGAWYMEADRPIAVIFYQGKGLTGFERMESMIIGTPGRAAAVGGVAGGAGALAIGIVSGTVAAPVTLTVVGVGAAWTVVGAATGAGGGVFASLAGRPELSTMSVVVVRPLDRAEMDKLGCTYAPVANK